MGRSITGDVSLPKGRMIAAHYVYCIIKMILSRYLVESTENAGLCMIFIVCLLFSLQHGSGGGQSVA